MVTCGAVKGAAEGRRSSCPLTAPQVTHNRARNEAKRSSVELRSIVEWFSHFFFLGPPRGHPHSASPFWHSASSSFRFGHRTFWICFEPSPLGNSGRRHPTVAMLLSAL